MLLTPLGPGWFIFFHNEDEHFVGTGAEEIKRKRGLKRKREEDIIMMVIKKFLEVHE